MWSFGRSNKQSGPPSKKVIDIPNIRMLELTGDLIGHSGAVQVHKAQTKVLSYNYVMPGLQ